jgi:hypothetical protein
MMVAVTMKPDRFRQRGVMIRVAGWIAGGLLFAWLATSADPDKLGPWIVGGLVLLCLIWTVLLVRAGR